MSETPSQPDQLLLTDAFVPSLTAGQYTLTAKQALILETEPGKPVKVEPLKDSKTFSVAAPRFSLDPDEIYSVYPPDGSSGAYDSTVPHVVFRRKTLPWERKLMPGEPPPGQPPAPWMALLLFDEGELAGHPFETRLVTELGFELADWEKNPPPDANGERNNRCKTLAIPWELFRTVRPLEDELRYLAHTRGVFKNHKEDVPGIGDGWFSVILSNRLPTPKVDSASEAPPNRNVAVLISLEGLSDLLKPDASRQDKEEVRLVVLATWSFASTGPTFQKRVEALHSNSRGERDLWLRAPMPTANGAVQTALKLGYAPLPHQLRQGSRTVSWYRGPLIPVPDDVHTVNEIFVNADAALQYDRNTGLFDVSYAAAWQLGRLLALQAPEFAWALFLMQRGYVADNLMEEAEKQFRGLFGQEPDLKRARRMLQDDLMNAIAVEFCE
jgi:hypothetical protein